MPLFLIRPTTEKYGITPERTFWTHEITTIKTLRPTKYPREKIWDPRNNHEKICWTHEIPTRKNFGPMKSPQRHDGMMALDPRDPRWHATYEI